MNSQYDNSWEAQNNIWVQQARSDLAAAQQRIVRLEEALQERDKSRNALKAVACAVRDALSQLDPKHPLTITENREKIYNANFRT